MSDSEKPTALKSAQLWVAVIVAVSGCIAGPMFIVPEQTRQLRETVTTLNGNVTKLADELKSYKDTQVNNATTVNTDITTLKSQMASFDKLSDEIKRHLADKTIHVTEDQMKNLIIAQLQPLALTMKGVESSTMSQDKQLTRIETDVKDLTTLFRQIQTAQITGKVAENPKP